jgi:hypothetical protein
MKPILNQAFNAMKTTRKPMRTLLLLFILPLQVLLAQPPDAEEKIEKVQAAKVAYITSRLNLNTTQSQAFWPVFNEFEAARRKIRFQMKGLHREAKHGQQNEEQMKASIRRRLALRQEELDLEKQYAEKFMKVLSAEQVSELYESEKEFTKLLLHKWKGGGEAGGRRKGGRGDFPED